MSSKEAKIIRSPYFANNEEDSVPEDGSVPDCIDYDLRVLFIGINPGMASSQQQHHFAGPTNHFWPCLSQSGFVDTPLTYRDDIKLPKKHLLGITNLTDRATRTASHLSLKEQRENRPKLTAKISHYRPQIACFVGKGIYEIYAGEKCQKMGLQSMTIPWENGHGHSLVFVMPSTSGIVSTYQKPDKLRFFKQLFKEYKKLQGHA